MGGGREGVTRAISPLTLSHTWQPLGATKSWETHCLEAEGGKEGDAEAAIEQRVLPAQRGALQRGGPHPLRRLLHLRPSTSCSGPPPDLHQGQQRLQQGHG